VNTAKEWARIAGVRSGDLVKVIADPGADWERAFPGNTRTIRGLGIGRIYKVSRVSGLQWVEARSFRRDPITLIYLPYWILVKVEEDEKERDR